MASNGKNKAGKNGRSNGKLPATPHPKGKALPTDLNRDIVRVTLEPLGLEVVSQVAIDETWSALRAKIV